MVRRIIVISMLLIAVALLLPLVFFGWYPGRESADQDDPPAETKAADSAADAAVILTAQINGLAVQTTMADYLPCVLAAEMPASFEMEALKAQAIAARTYILYRMQQISAAHPDAQICDDFACCAAYKSEETLRETWGAAFEANWAKIRKAVQETGGQYMVYNEQPIQAVFHSSSAGMTEDSANLWGDQPYLISVMSPETAEEVPNFVASVTFSADEFRRVILMAEPRVDLSGDVSEWVQAVESGKTGRVESVTIGDTVFSGTEIRELFALRSTAFSLEYGGGQFVFTTKGYGHGVGMSQYGANALAKQGHSCMEILEHYYHGISITV